MVDEYFAGFPRLNAVTSYNILENIAADFKHVIWSSRALHKVRVHALMWLQYLQIKTLHLRPLRPEPPRTLQNPLKMKSREISFIPQVISFSAIPFENLYIARRSYCPALC